MSKYKRIMLRRGVMQKDVSESVRKVDPRVDTALMSKFVNDVCLPTPPVLKAICKTLSCAPLDIYDPREIALTDAATPANSADAAISASTTKKETERSRERRRKNDFYNLTVEIPRDVAERVFAPAALRKLGYLSKSDFVRQAVAALDARLSTIESKEKTADAGTSDGQNN